MTQEESTKTKQYVVSLKFKSKGTKAFATATEEAAPSHKMIYIVYDGKVISNPGVTEAITNGEAQISGGFKTYDEAEELASYIRIGALPVELKAAQSQVVGAQLGLDAIQSSLLAGAIGFGLVVLFMIIFYRLPGLASSIALVFYLGLMLVALNVLDITLTLPGIAGIILNIGMAVDANVIIFTRIKEELAKGKSVQSGIKIGFDKALSAIIDGNVTTLIAAAVLYVKGSGTVKGFATTLALGIILSMFTALVITKLLLNAMYSLGMDDVKYFGVEKPRKPIHFVENRLKFFCISGAIILACVVTLGVNKASRCGGNILNYGLDFLGGTTYDITFPDKTDLNADLKSDLEKLFSKTAKSNDVVISEVAGRNAKKLKVKAHFVRTDMFDGLKGVFDMIVCNPPYVKTEEIDRLDVNVREHEPRVALDGGADGLDFYRIIARRASDFLKSGGRLYLEVGYGQAELVAGLLRENFFVNIKKDYDDIERMILAQKK